MTVAMGSTSSQPAAPAAKASSNANKNSMDKDAGAVAGGFDAILSSVDQDVEPSPAEATPVKAETKSDDAAQVKDPAEVLADAVPDQNLLLANMCLSVQTNVPATTNTLTAVEGESKSDALATIFSKSTGLTPFSAEKMSSEGANRTKEALSDGAQDAVAALATPVEASSKVSPVVKDDKSNTKQSLLSALEEARVTRKEGAVEQMQKKSEDTSSLDLLKSVSAEVAKRPQDASYAKPHFGEFVGGGMQSQGQSAVPYQSTVQAMGSTLPTESPSGQQVAYWVSPDIQNAEMTLDGLGSDPVEVSISVHGKEADVTFRTDEVQTRELLEGSSNKLKDLMSREGMVLTGMSVGSNGSGGTGPDGQGGGRQRQALRPMIATVAPLSRAGTAGRSTGSVGKSLDLFV